jgi:hypothetical protein
MRSRTKRGPISYVLIGLATTRMEKYWAIRRVTSRYILMVPNKENLILYGIEPDEYLLIALEDIETERRSWLDARRSWLDAHHPDA